MTTLRLSVLAALALFFSGCLLVTPPPSRSARSRAALSSSRDDHQHRKVERCRPSQYWDGDRCVHKGKGRGARKHDGR